MHNFISFLILFFGLQQTFAQNCQPQLSLVSPALVEVKEGHYQKVSLIDMNVEMDRYCPGETISLTLLVLSETAVVGEHVQIEEINQIVIPAGQISSGLSIGIIGDNKWNENRTFSVRIINPSQGSIGLAQTRVVIKNDDPKIKMVFPQSVEEPKSGVKEVPLKLTLEYPSDQIITGEIEIRGLSATLGEDFIASYSIGFEFLPGDTTFEFLPNTLLVSSDDLKEKIETLSFYMNLSEGASPDLAYTEMQIKDPQVKYKLTMTSVIKGISDHQVAMISTYQLKAELFEDEGSKKFNFKSDVLRPQYRHEVVGTPFKPQVQPGLIQISAQIVNDQLNQFRLEFRESPFEIYPFNPQPLYMYMSSFGKLHEDEFTTIQNQSNSEYPVFDLKQFKKSGPKVWKATYQRSLSEEGTEVLQEQTTLLLEEE